MKRPIKKIFGLTWLGALNFFILQWFFVRLGCYCCTGGSNPEHVTFCILKFIVPLTGWWTPYTTFGYKCPIQPTVVKGKPNAP